MHEKEEGRNKRKRMRKWKRKKETWYETIMQLVVCVHCGTCNCTLDKYEGHKEKENTSEQINRFYVFFFFLFVLFSHSLQEDSFILTQCYGRSTLIKRLSCFPRKKRNTLFVWHRLHTFCRVTMSQEYITSLKVWQVDAHVKLSPRTLFSLFNTTDQSKVTRKLVWWE